MPIAHRMETNKTHTKMKIKNIEGYDGMYQVSECGKVYSQIKELKQTLNKGYLYLNLKNNGIQKFCSVHRLVALNFIANPQNKPQVNHIDGNKQNNNVSNLEWATAKENTNHAYDTGLQIQKKGSESKLSKSVVQLDLQNNVIKIWDCMMDVQRELGFNLAHIVGCCKLKVGRKTAYGFKWRYNV